MDTLIFNRPAGPAEALIERLPTKAKELILSFLSVPDLLHYKFVNARAFHEAQNALAHKAKEYYGVADPYAWNILNGFMIRNEGSLSLEDATCCFHLQPVHLKNLPHKLAVTRQACRHIFDVNDVIRCALQNHGSVKRIILLDKACTERGTNQTFFTRVAKAKLWTVAMRELRKNTESVFGGFRDCVENYVTGRWRGLHMISEQVQLMLTSFRKFEPLYQKTYSKLFLTNNVIKNAFDNVERKAKELERTYRPLGLEDKNQHDRWMIFAFVRNTRTERAPVEVVMKEYQNACMRMKEVERAFFQTRNQVLSKVDAVRLVKEDAFISSYLICGYLHFFNSVEEYLLHEERKYQERAKRERDEEGKAKNDESTVRAVRIKIE